MHRTFSLIARESRKHVSNPREVFPGVCRTHLGLTPREHTASPNPSFRGHRVSRAYRPDRPVITPVTIAPTRPSDALIGQP